MTEPEIIQALELLAVAFALAVAGWLMSRWADRLDERRVEHPDRVLSLYHFGKREHDERGRKP